jgi:hypothetical protein
MEYEMYVLIFFRKFGVLLTVHISIIFIINQLNSQTLVL